MKLLVVAVVHLLMLLLLLTATCTQAQAPLLLTSPIGEGSTPAKPWRVALLPRQKPPATRFSVITLEGQRVLRIEAKASYGNLMHEVAAEHANAQSLRWSWRTDLAPPSDLRSRQGDDVALKVCALFDWPQSRLPFGERTKLATASLIAGEELPTAVLCYVVDPNLATGTWLANAYTRRIRMLVVQGGEGAVGPAWRDHARNLHTDFRHAFADEWKHGDEVPPLLAVLVGGDTDNTSSEGLGYLRTVELLR
jgi:Protein of unknown function (DUF3047)